MNTITLKGSVVQGHQVASRPSDVYPYGTIEKQKPYFKELGLNLDGFYSGTLNISISPNTFEVTNPEITFENLKWTELNPPETFSFSRCTLIHKGIRHAGWIYYPHSETKVRHFNNPAVIEVLAQHIPDIHYGDEVELELSNEEISIIEK